MSFAGQVVRQGVEDENASTVIDTEAHSTAPSDEDGVAEGTITTQETPASESIPAPTDTHAPLVGASCAVPPPEDAESAVPSTLQDSKVFVPQSSAQDSASSTALFRWSQTEGTLTPLATTSDPTKMAGKRKRRAASDRGGTSLPVDPVQPVDTRGKKRKAQRPRNAKEKKPKLDPVWDLNTGQC